MSDRATQITEYRKEALKYHKLSKQYEDRGHRRLAEENKRKAEKSNTFDDAFIKLSRDVYKTNDQRAKIKLEINVILGSNIKEVKSHY